MIYVMCEDLSRLITDHQPHNHHLLRYDSSKQIEAYAYRVDPQAEFFFKFRMAGNKFRPIFGLAELSR